MENTGSNPSSRFRRSASPRIDLSVFWEELAAKEYGFWANVNPEVDHPRWSQATERDLETGKRIPTLLFNGYGEQVAGLYEGMEGESLYM